MLLYSEKIAEEEGEKEGHLSRPSEKQHIRSSSSLGLSRKRGRGYFQTRSNTDFGGKSGETLPFLMREMERKRGGEGCSKRLFLLNARRGGKKGKEEIKRMLFA